ncbi:putative ADP ribosylation factor 79F [Diplonema papillatum]|nr:putative ADP ribosylation factor 79F [Diplonema papillatum]
MADGSPLVLVFGSVGSGTSTLLEQLRAHCKGVCQPGRSMRKMYPTMGVDISKVAFRGKSFRVVEVGGSMLSHAHRQIAVHGNDVRGVVFVVDSTAPQDLPVSVIELYNLMSHPTLRERATPFLVVYNKQDAPCKMPRPVLDQALGLDDIQEQADVAVEEVSAITGLNVQSVADWMFEKVSR